MMHRSYQPILPCGNKFLQQKWDKTYYDEHQRKVHTAKPMVDASAPPTYGHLNLKLKKLKLEEERLSIIERDNRLLMEKMSCIMRTKGGVDNINHYESKSLNREKREQELLKITRENQTILDRIEKCEPQYQVQKWAEDYQKAEQYMDSIAKYPRGWYNTPHDKTRPKGSKKIERESSKSRPKKEDNQANGTREARSEEKSPQKGKQQPKAEVAGGKREEAKRQDPKAEKIPNKVLKDEKQNSKNEKLPTQRNGEMQRDETEKVKSEKTQLTKANREKESDGEEETDTQEEPTEDEERVESKTDGPEDVPDTDGRSTAADAGSNMEEAEQDKTYSSRTSEHD
ncbi:uncharacterized protein CFAP97D2 [Ambystoma mexicanum]|uniref:uncharacterized protein CFAP97D2 n=1 Tax=Ambystoma mexicanum TaxID=8296 RepID=UPI0037E81153